MKRESKECKSCGELKPLGDFHTDRSASDGKLYRCKKCISTVKAKYYLKNKRKIKKAIKDKKKERLPMYFPKVTHDYYTELYNSYWLSYFASRFKEKALKSLNARIEIIEDNSYLVIPSKV